MKRYKKRIGTRFSKIPYRHKVSGVIFLFILIPFLVLSLLIMKSTWDDKVDNILGKSENHLSTGVEALNYLLLSNLQKLTFLNNHNAMISYLKQGQYDDFVDNIRVYDTIRKMIDALVIDNPNISLAIYPLEEKVYNGQYIEKLSRLEKELGEDSAGILKQLLRLEWNECLWRYESAALGGKNAADGGMGYIRCYKKMQALDAALAVTRMSIKVESLLKYIEEDFPPGSLILYSPDRSSGLTFMQQKTEFEEERWITVEENTDLALNKYYGIQRSLGYSTGKFTVYVPKAYVHKELWSFLLILLLVVVLAAFTLFWIVELASYFITRRLTRIIEKINREAELSPFLPEPESYFAEDDLGQLEIKFYEMLDKMRESYNKALIYENEMKNYELELMQSRINPHFLYNTLSTMKWHCNNEKLAGIIDAMVAYYRLALNRGDRVVKIAHELKLVEEYLKIQKYTYESDFKYEFEVEKEVEEFPTIRHLLQPIVENAVLHGVNGLDEGGRIKITGHKVENLIVITIWDNGVGMDSSTVELLVKSEYKSKLGGYGIKNVRNRIQLFYGPEASLQIESSKGKGTNVTLSLPYFCPAASEQK